MSGANGAHRTLVKICGLTRLDDARAAQAAGADWLGFVMKHDGPRMIAPERVREITASLAGPVTVAVMVAPSPDEALRLASAGGTARVQLHGVDPAVWPSDFPLPVTFAIPVAADGSITAALPLEPHGVLLDTAHPSLAGGTGTTFPWETARIVAATRPVFLAGGLDPDNVSAAIRQVRPLGVDASSRLERAPGIKDPDRVRRFVAAVRAADREWGGPS